MANSRTKRLCATALFALLLSTTAVPVVAQTLDDFAARGEVLAAADPRAADLRSRLDEAGRRGFDIGMGAAGNDTLPGPGKQAIHDSLPVDQQAGYATAVLFAITRNANAGAANRGIRIAQGDPRLSDARGAEDDGFYALGFDIATGLLYDSGSGPFGEIQQSVGAGAVHNSLTGATRRGFEASAQLHGRNYGSFPGKSTPITPPGDLAVSDSTTDGTAGVDRVGSVPNVVGMAAGEALGTLRAAGYAPAEAEINNGPAQPPYDRVIGMKPAAGTTLPRDSKVEYQIPRAWIFQGHGTLHGNDYGRLGFDFDTGKYALIDDGADIYATLRVIPPERSYDTSLNLNFFSPGADVTMVRLPQSYSSDPPAITHWLSYQDCVRRFRELKQTIVENGSGDYCIVTRDQHTVRLSVTEDGQGGFNFRYATFAGNARFLKAQGRVVTGAPVKKLPICEAAKKARDRGSPATPGLTKQCLDSGGTIPQ
jgi:hypothetical protein